MSDKRHPGYETVASRFRVNLDRFELRGRDVTAAGWVLVPHSDIEQAAILINDQRADSVNFYEAPDIKSHFRVLPERVCYRFDVSTRLDTEARKAVLEFLPFGRRDSHVVAETCWSIRTPDRDFAQPEGFNIERVIGNDSEFSYRLGGSTIVDRFDRYLTRSLERPLSSFRSILDWGCGAGRTIRYLPKDARLYGTDIDEVNIKWCKANLPFADFHVSPLMPPLPFDDNSMELILGLSVFTHLHEDVQDAWLLELSRVLATDGLALLTINSESQRILMGSPQHEVESISKKGFFVVGRNPQLDFQSNGRDYYVDVSHAHWYVYERWSRYFSIIDIVPFLGTSQDVVVARPRR